MCCKNHQGSVANKYQRFCHGVSAFENYHYDYLTHNTIQGCESSYDRHLADHVPYWDRLTEPGKEKNLWLDAWCHRTCDNLAATPMGLCIVEGIYGRDDAFLTGPNPPLHNDKGKREAWDYMTNILIFGKNPVLVDIIGHWLGGHEPGQFGFFHIALERGLTQVIDPRKIPVYTWENGAAKLTPLNLLQRTPLLSSYIPKDGYDTSEGAHSSLFYMYNDPYDYGKINETLSVVPTSPKAQVFDNTGMSAANPFVIFEYTLPADGFARLDIADSSGNRVETVANGYFNKGAHCVKWNAADYSGGTYYYTFSYRDFSESGQIQLI